MNMSQIRVILPACGALAFSAGGVMACEHDVPEALSGADAVLQSAIERHLFSLLPAEHQARITEAGAAPTTEQALDAGMGVMNPDDDAYARLSRWVSPELYARMQPEHVGMFLRVLDDAAAGRVPAMFCFSSDMDPDLAAAYDQLLYGTGTRFQQTSRWTTTASGPTGGQGTPITLTYSFAPDGTQIEDLNGTFRANELFAWLNSRYAGGFNQWKPLFDQVFDRWNEVANITYIYEPNDDGVNFTNGNTGVLGVRGDVRIGAVRLDGNSNVLAYNNFPNFGDMVFDAFDSFYNTVSNNSLRLRNVIAHEHGHGLGMLHVCPIQQNKLMEPFVSTLFDGPQIDDILNGQRHYGDPLESNDTPATASALGSVGVGGFAGAAQVSIDDNADVDYYSVSIPARARLTATVTPQGGTYLQGPQTSACNTGASTNYTSIQNLSVEILDANTLAVLASANVNPTGQAESVFFDFSGPTNALVRVNGDSTNSIQLYDLLVEGGAVPFIEPSILIATTPDLVEPGVPTPISVSVDAGDDTVQGTPSLSVRIDGGSFTTVPLAGSGSSFSGTLPAVLCGSTIEYFVTVVGQTSGTITDPAAGASAPYSAGVGVEQIAIEDTFQTDLGWTVTGSITTAAAGRWERGVPGGDGSRGDPAGDGDGSSACYITGNGGPGSNTDVDSGSTILTSPALDLSDNPEALVSYYRWYNNVAGAAPNADIFEVEISNNNGASWVDLETVGPGGPETQGGWFFKSFRVADFVTPTSQVLVRFTASDLGDGSVVEAGVDGFSIAGTLCENPDDCVADINGDGNVNFADVSAFVSAFGVQGTAADINGDGNINFADVSAFVSAFSAGC